MNQRPSPLRKPIAYSAIIHVIILITSLALPGIYIPFRDRSLKIDLMWVELPKGSGEDIGLGVKESKSLPESTIEEQRKLFQPEPTPGQKILSPEIKAPPEKPPEEKPKEKTKPDDRPKIDTSKMTKTDEKAKPLPAYKGDRKIRDALAKIDKELSGRQVVPESGQVGASTGGYKYGTSDKPLRVSPSDPEYLKYQAMVRAKIIREWVIPARYSEEGGGVYRARLEVMINMDGDVTSARWAKTSGNASFDQSAMRAVRKASPFPRPPDRLAWEAYNEGFLIEFDARLKP